MKKLPVAIQKKLTMGMFILPEEESIEVTEL